MDRLIDRQIETLIDVKYIDRRLDSDKTCEIVRQIDRYIDGQKYGIDIKNRQIDRQID